MSSLTYTVDDGIWESLAVVRLRPSVGRDVSAITGWCRQMWGKSHGSLRVSVWVSAQGAVYVRQGEPGSLAKLTWG
jgi:hypothetical protein